MTTSKDMTKAAADALHARLLELHKTLLDAVRADYEREHGPVPGPGALLQLVTQDAAFAWLRPLSMLLVELDDPEVLAAAGGPRALAERVFSPGNLFFDGLAALAPTPAILAARDAATRAMKALP